MVLAFDKDRDRDKDRRKLLRTHIKLRMEARCHEVGVKASWKLRTLLRILRYYDLKDVFAQYKAQVLLIVEFSTPAVFHATTTALALLDKLQTYFLKEVGLTALEALQKYNLAPLST